MAKSKPTSGLHFDPEGDFETNLSLALETLEDRDLASVLARNSQHIRRLDADNTGLRRQPIVDDLKELIERRLREP